MKIVESIATELAIAPGWAVLLGFDLYHGGAPSWELTMNAIGVILFLFAAFFKWQAKRGRTYD